MKKILTIIVLFVAGCALNKKPVEPFPLEPLSPKYILPNREYDLLHRHHRVAERQIVIPKDKEFCNEKG